jgi:flagellar biosynthesis protein
MKKAIALEYHDDIPAPFLSAKGLGREAERIIAVAAEAGVPLKEDAETLSALFPLDVGSFIPENYYEAVAKILIAAKRVEELSHEKVSD